MCELSELINGGSGGDDLMDQIDWDRLINNDSFAFNDDPNFFDNLNILETASSGEEAAAAPPIVVVKEIENFLMNDDALQDLADLSDPNYERFFSDDLINSPGESNGSGGGEVVDGSDSDHQKSEEFSEISGSPENGKRRLEEVDNGDLAEEEDHVSKKRKRQERNRDAALRSRERKKLYVKDLEMKSRYFEGECRRLGMLLNCVMAENQALRMSLTSNKAFDASRTKQESAVLLLESLLLGSLLWFLGIICLLLLEPLPSKVVQLKNVDNQNRGSLVPRGAGSRVLERLSFHSFMMGKRCRASRSRMKQCSFASEVLVRLI